MHERPILMRNVDGCRPGVLIRLAELFKSGRDLMLRARVEIDRRFANSTPIVTTAQPPCGSVSPLFLVAATSVIAAPASVTEAPPMHLSQLEQRDWIMDKLKPLFQKAIIQPSVRRLGAKFIAYLNKNWVLDAANSICREMKLMDADVCPGIVYSQGPVLIQVALQANLLSGDGKMICF
ncbi:hypothetical protein BG006_010495 [Podila minutissima]|uniref:Uncharacterized protein n=1 Tax=Podila minutissima TaxID=64525 RepID=A0A9P5VII5_9FUNG|nr:hypothetical protein BG006_010495 [Podila minutissima]